MKFIVTINDTSKFPVVSGLKSPKKVYIIEISDGYGRFVIDSVFDDKELALSYIQNKIALVNDYMKRNNYYKNKELFVECEVFFYKKDTGAIKQWSSDYLNVYLIERELNRIQDGLESFGLVDSDVWKEFQQTL